MPRVRRSTWALAALFVSVLVLYLTVRPDDVAPTAPAPVPVFVVPTTTEPPTTTSTPPTTTASTTSTPAAPVPSPPTVNVPVPTSSSEVGGPSGTAPWSDEPAPVVTEAG